MKFIIKLAPEIIVKSLPVRKKFIRHLRFNVQKSINEIDNQVHLKGSWDNLVLTPNLETKEILLQITERLSCIPGIAFIQQIEDYHFQSMDDILYQCLEDYSEVLNNKSFAVRVKRSGNHSFKSTDVECYIGAGLLDKTTAAKVRLKNPEVLISIEIKNNRFYMIKKRIPGLGGFPLGTQDETLSLISGGFDSTVASFLCMKRGVKTHYCFFNLGGNTHEIGVKQVALYIWQKYGSSHKVKFITVPFQNVLAEIIENIESSQMGVVLKRMMLRAADQVADLLQVQSIVTGESIAQVSSQTLANLAVIDKACEKLVLRPLATYDKQEIINISAKIGTEDFAKNMPEYCGVISVKPTTRAKLYKIEAEENNFDFKVLENAITNLESINIDQVMESIKSHNEVDIVKIPAIEDIIVDIRHPQEEQQKPLFLTNNNIIKMPFYQINSQFSRLNNDSSRYLLYCGKGIMSELHALHIKDSGYDNIAVYKPDHNSK